MGLRDAGGYKNAFSGWLGGTVNHSVILECYSEKLGSEAGLLKTTLFMFFMGSNKKNNKGNLRAR